MNRKLKLEELNRLDVEAFKKSDKIPVAVVLDNIRSLNNIGSVFRTSDAFKISHVYLCGITATPPHREITKTAIGATESVSWSYHERTIDLVKQLKEKGEKIYAIEQTENAYELQKVNFRTSYPKVVNIVMGNEVEGVSQEVINNSDAVIEIPQFGTKHSLNISVCTGVVLWEAIKSYI